MCLWPGSAPKAPFHARHLVSIDGTAWKVTNTDADAGFAGNEELTAELLGITPSRFVPQSTAGTLPTEAEEG